MTSSCYSKLSVVVWFIANFPKRPTATANSRQPELNRQIPRARILQPETNSHSPIAKVLQQASYDSSSTDIVIIRLWSTDHRRVSLHGTPAAQLGSCEPMMVLASRAAASSGEHHAVRPPPLCHVKRRSCRLCESWIVLAGCPHGSAGWPEAEPKPNQAVCRPAQPAQPAVVPFCVSRRLPAAITSTAWPNAVSVLTTAPLSANLLPLLPIGSCLCVRWSSSSRIV